MPRLSLVVSNPQRNRRFANSWCSIHYRVVVSRGKYYYWKSNGIANHCVSQRAKEVSMLFKLHSFLLNIITLRKETLIIICIITPLRDSFLSKLTRNISYTDTSEDSLFCILKSQKNVGKLASMSLFWKRRLHASEEKQQLPVLVSCQAMTWPMSMKSELYCVIHLPSGLRYPIFAATLSV